MSNVKFLGEIPVFIFDKQLARSLGVEALAITAYITSFDGKDSAQAPTTAQDIATHFGMSIETTEAVLEKLIEDGVIIQDSGIAIVFED